VYEIKSYLENDCLLIMIWDLQGLCILFEFMRLNQNKERMYLYIDIYNTNTLIY